MALHPQADAFLNMANTLSTTPYHQLGAIKAREAYEQRPSNMAPEWVSVFQVDNHTIDASPFGGAYKLPIRIYTPVASDNVLPIVVFYHGGGMVIGTLNSYDTLCRQLAIQSKCIVVSVDYRLAPENQFPAAVDDAYAALLWIAEQAATFNGDAERIAVAGDSAGGSLAAVVCLLARNNRSVTLRGQLLIYPATAPYANSPSHFSCAEGYFLERETVLWFHNCYLRSDKDRNDFRYAPLIADDLSQLPPAFVIVAGYDTLRDEGIAYANRLEASGVKVELVEYHGMFHPFVSLAGVLDEGKRAIHQSATALQYWLTDHQG